MFDNNDKFIELLNLYQRPVMAFVYRYINSFSDADDITQDVFISVFKNIDKLNNYENPKSWIFTVARNKSISFLRWRKIRNFLGIEDDNHYTNDEIKEYITGSNDEEFIMKNIMIRNAMDDLTFKEKEVLTLRSSGFTISEISKIIGSKEGTIKAQIFNAKNKIKKILGGDL